MLVCWLPGLVEGQYVTAQAGARCLSVASGRRLFSPAEAISFASWKMA